MQLILFCLIVVLIFIFAFLSIYKVVVEPYTKEEDEKRKIKYLNEYSKVTKLMDEKTKNLLYLDALKEIEIAKYKYLAQAYNKAKISMVVSDPEVISDGFGAKQGASLGNFMKAVELVSGTSMNDLATKVAEKMEKNELS